MSSNSSALAIVGAAVGFAVGGPPGAQWGAMIGGTLGGQMDANATHYRGPRLSDLSVQKVEEGAPIPIIFGTMRVAGNVLACSEKIPHANTTAAKGSGPKTTAYTYTVDIAIEFAGCTDPRTSENTPIIGIRRMWANSMLFYDVSADAGASSLLASGRLCTSIKIYTGTEDQMPDPTLEALLGAGLVPGYRGKAYVVLSGLQITDFGNQVPIIHAEIVASGTESPYRRMVAATIPQQWRTLSTEGLGYPTMYSADGVVRVGVAGGIGGTAYLYDLDGNYLGRETRSALEAQWPIIKYTEDSVDWWGVGRLWDGQPLYLKAPYRRVMGGGAALRTGSAYAVHADASGGLPSGRQLLTACLSADGRYILSITAAAGSINGGASGDQWHLCEWTGTAAVLHSQGTIESPVNEYVFGPGSQSSANMAGGGFGVGMLENDLTHLWMVFGAGAGEVTLCRIDADDVMRVEHVWSGASGITPATFCFPTVQANAGVCVTITGNGLCIHTRLPAITPSDVPLADVIATLCKRSGLTAADIDVSRITDTVRGYAVTTQATGRAALDPLRAYAPFDVVDDGGQLLFIPRGADVAATIPWADLAAREGGDHPEPLQTTVADESELPNAVTVIYADIDADYQSGAQSARRNTAPATGQAWPVAPAINEQRIELPMAMTAARAARIAEQLLWEAWTGRRTAKFSVGIKYAALRPADVVVIVGDDATYRLRITRITESGLVRQMEAVFEEASIYAAAPPAVPTLGVPQQQIVMSGPTRLDLLDVPLLRDTDDDPGFYAAVSRYLAGWPGATLIASADGGASWADVQTFANSATVGSAEDVLPALVGGNVFDEASRVTIRLPPGLELASITAAAVLGGGNAALLGDELIHFRDAVLIGANLYRLSGLLRGRRGTESAMSTHAVGERFVLLAGVGGLARVPASASEIGAARDYRAITAGDTLDSAGSITFANTARGLKPLSPVHVAAGRNAAGDVLIQWARRGRLDTEWRDYVDVPIGETVERYEIDIVSSAGAVVRTLTATTPAVAYTADDCLADLGALVTSLHVRIYQMSSVVGRGTPADVTLTLPAFSRVVDPFFAGMLGTSVFSRQFLLLARDGNAMVAMCTGGKSVSGSNKVCRRFFKTTTGDVWEQVGSDITWTPAALVEWQPSFVLAAARNVGGWMGYGALLTAGVREFVFAASNASLPVSRGAGFAATDAPLSLAYYSGTWFVSTASGKLYKSTDDGVTWALAGTLPNAGPVYRTSTGWVQIVGEPTASNPTASTPELWFSNDGNALGGWSLKLAGTTATGYPLAAMPNPPSITGGEVYLDVWGREFVGGDVGATTTRKSVIFRSTDGGQTWAVDMVADGNTVGAYPNAFVPASKGPVHVVGSAVFRLSPVVVSTMQPNLSLKRHAAQDWRIVETAGVPAYNSHSMHASSYAMAVTGNLDKPVPRYSTDGLTWRDPVVTLTP